MTSAMLVDTAAPAPLVDLRRPALRVWTAGRAGDGPLVRRPRLVRPLCDPDGPPLVLILAPAGYGKTTLLREWEERDRRAFAWVTLDERDNDSHRIVAAVARAVDAAVGDDADARFVLVLDDVHAVYTRQALEALAATANDLPAPATLVLAGRREPELPLARMRVQQLVADVGRRELALTRSELVALLKEAGQELDREAVDTLVRLTEGWPVAISLAARFLAERGAGDVSRFHGDDRLVLEYVRDEVLSDLSPELLDFVGRTAVADSLTRSLCDALLERSGSAAALDRLRRAGLVLPVDRTGERFRYHRLVGEALCARLHRLDPDLEAVLHRRACAWHRSSGDVDRALHHALAAGDVRAAGELVGSGIAEAAARGCPTAIERWLSRFGREQIAADATLALAAAGCELLRGHGHLAEYWASTAALANAGSGTRRDIAAGVALMRAAIGGDGLARMRDDAARAALLQPANPASRSLSCLLGGVARHLLGEREAAVQELEEGARRAAVVVPKVHALCLAELAALEAERDDWDAAAPLIERARAQVDRYRLADFPTTALVLAVAALVRAHRGRLEEARSDLAEATRLEAALVDFAPWYRAEARILLARAALRLGDVNAARVHLAAAARVAPRVRDAPALQEWLRQASTQLDSFTASGDALTAAELRILRFLPTHMSFREIAERTHVSANTVKTQANAVYRKLDVSCRSDAVTRARSCGLLDA